MFRVSCYVALALTTMTAGSTKSMQPLTNDHGLIRLSLRPLYQPYSTQPSALEVALNVDGKGWGSGDHLMTMPKFVGSTPTSNLSSSAMMATDRDGTLPLKFSENERNVRSWKLLRAPVGRISLTYVVEGDVVHPGGPRGPYVNLVSQDDCISGVGFSFIPELHTDHKYWLSISWLLDRAPSAHTAAWTFSQGSLKTRILGQVRKLTETVYAAGDLWPQFDDSGRQLAMIWMGRMTFDTDAIFKDFTSLRENMANFFQDPNPGNRVFARRNIASAVTGGTAVDSSFMLSVGWKESSADSVLGVIAHEMIHRWVQLESSNGHSNLEKAWYDEGATEYYSLILRHRFGVIGDASLLRILNAQAMAYLSNPVRNYTAKRAATLAWRNPLAQVLPYQRGVMYFGQLENELRKQNTSISVDDLVLALLGRKRSTLPYTEEIWRSLLEESLGIPGIEAFDAMLQGKVVVPSRGMFGLGNHIVDEECAEFDLGFDPSSLTKGKVHGLVKQSNAARAGVFDGDRILRSTPLRIVMAGLATEMELVINRSQSNGHVSKTLTYQPRGTTTSTCYRWVPSEGPGALLREPHD